MRSFLTVLATAAACSLTGAAPAHAATPYCVVSMEAAGTGSGSSAFHDTAVLAARCYDVSPSVHHTEVVWQWWFFDFGKPPGPGAAGPVPGCPTSTTPAVPPVWSGAAVVTATADCQRPAGWLGPEVERLVCVDLIFDGTPYVGALDPITPGYCDEVPDV